MRLPERIALSKNFRFAGHKAAFLCSVDILAHFFGGISNLRAFAMPDTAEYMGHLPKTTTLPFDSFARAIAALACGSNLTELACLNCCVSLGCPAGPRVPLLLAWVLGVLSLLALLAVSELCFGSLSSLVRMLAFSACVRGFGAAPVEPDFAGVAYTFGRARGPRMDGLVLGAARA